MVGREQAGYPVIQSCDFMTLLHCCLVNFYWSCELCCSIVLCSGISFLLNGNHLQQHYLDGIVACKFAGLSCLFAHFEWSNQVVFIIWCFLESCLSTERLFYFSTRFKASRESHQKKFRHYFSVPMDDTPESYSDDAFIIMP
jgi:hypothetical protein